MTPTFSANTPYAPTLLTASIALAAEQDLAGLVVTHADVDGQADANQTIVNDHAIVVHACLSNATSNLC